MKEVIAMKVSQYNIYIPADGAYVVYNTLTGALFKTNKEGIGAIQEVRKEKFNQETIQDLKKNGIWVDDTVDERKTFQVFHEHYKYSGNRAYICSYVTFKCDLACEYCYLEYFNFPGSKPVLSMSNETAWRVVDFAKNVVHDNHCSELVTVFTGGEPFLNFSAISTIIKKLDNWAKKQGVNYQSIIFSNGTALTEDIINELSRYNVFFQITLIGAAPIHNKKRPYKNGRGSYNTIIKTLELLKDYKANFGIRVDVDKENFDSIEEMLKDLTEKIGRGLYIKFFPIIPEPKMSPSQTKLCFELNELGRLSMLWDLARKMGFKVVLAPLMKYVYCDYHTNRGYIIDPDGDVYKCGVAVGVKERRIGNLDSSGRLMMCSHQYYDWMSRSPLLIEKCRNCEFLPACGGGCAGVAHNIHSTYHMSDCRERYLTPERIKFYLRERNKK